MKQQIICPICDGVGKIIKPKEECDYELTKGLKFKKDLVSVIKTLKESQIPYEVKKKARGYVVYRPKPTDLFEEE